MSKKLYSQLCMAIDLVSYQYKTSNPIILSELIAKDLGLEYSIHQIADHLDINRREDYEKQSRKTEYACEIF
jgi:hypothetical protein